MLVAFGMTASCEVELSLVFWGMMISFKVELILVLELVSPKKL